MSWVNSHWMERVEQLQRELAAEREAREKAEEALREIEMECGNPDPSDGEGTTPEEVVQSVSGLKQRAEKAEAKLAEAITLLRDTNDKVLSEFGCITDESRTGWAMQAIDKFLSSAEPPALLKEVEELRKRIHELQGVPFSDRNYGAMKAKLTSAIGLLSVAGCPCPNCDGSGAYQISETEIHQCQWCAERKSLIP